MTPIQQRCSIFHVVAMFALSAMASAQASSTPKDLVNLALNPDGLRGEFPKATSSSVCRNRPEFSHVNVINGRTENQGHGVNFPSWGPEMETNLWLKIDLGEVCDVEKVVITIRADFPHDSYWKSGVIEFSDGTRLPYTLKKMIEGQAILFPSKRVSWLKFTDLIPAEKKWIAYTEVEIWGRNIPGQ